VDLLVGDAAKARERLGWEPTVRFPELVRRMVDADLAQVKRELYGIAGEGDLASKLRALGAE
jgi:GDPmannose 4,6-dehydratase